MNDTVVKLITSDDYKDRFKGEYMELVERIVRLQNFLDKCDKGELDFTPTCDLEMLVNQLSIMKVYRYILQERAEVEGILLEVLPRRTGDV